MKIFVTGATGVLGRETIALLTAEGHQVRALARSEQNRRRLEQMQVEAVRGSLFDPPAWRTALTGCDAILHLATKIPSKTTIRNLSAWKENDRIRTVGTGLLVDAAFETGVSTIIYPSVVFLYPDNGDDWIDEDFPTWASPHVRSTLDAEREVARFQAHGGRGMTLRMGRFYGPDSWDAVDTVNAARHGLAMMPGRPDAYVPMIWVHDAARAVVAALHSAPSGIWNIVDHEPMQLREHSAVLAQAAGRKRLVGLPPILVPLLLGSSLSDVLRRSQRVSNRRFCEATGWSPLIPSAREGWPAIQAALRGNGTATSASRSRASESGMQ